MLISAVENKTVEIVEALGDEGVRAVPFLCGAAIIMMMLFLRVMVNRLWFDKQEEFTPNKTRGCSYHYSFAGVCNFLQRTGRRRSDIA